MKACGAIVTAFALAATAMQASAAPPAPAAAAAAPAGRPAAPAGQPVVPKVLGNPRPLAQPAPVEERPTPGFYVGVVTPQQADFGKRIRGGANPVGGMDDGSLQR